MRLKELRKLNGLYQKDLASLLNLSEAAISQYESGRREPDIDVYKRQAHNLFFP